MNRHANIMLTHHKHLIEFLTANINNNLKSKKLSSIFYYNETKLSYKLLPLQSLLQRETCHNLTFNI